MIQELDNVKEGIQVNAFNPKFQKESLLQDTASYLILYVRYQAFFLKEEIATHMNELF